jgi:hypothetical protein
MDNLQADKLTHELLPVVQMLHSYEQLANNPSFRLSPKILRKCALKIEEVRIEIRQVLTKES